MLAVPAGEVYLRKWQFRSLQMDPDPHIPELTDYKPFLCGLTFIARGSQILFKYM